MPGYLLHVGAQAICPHAGQILIVSTNTRVTVAKQAVATSADQFLIAGCPFVVGSVASPCVKVQWIAPAVRVKVNGQPAILATSTGLCLAATQVPQGAPNVLVTQVRVKGT